MVLGVEGKVSRILTSLLPFLLSQGPTGLTGRTGPTVSTCVLGCPMVGRAPSSLKDYLLSELCITPLSCLPDRVTQGLLERKESLGDLVPQDPLAPEEEM